jgi:hypothetical protein
VVIPADVYQLITVEVLDTVTDFADVLGSGSFYSHVVILVWGRTPEV